MAPNHFAGRESIIEKSPVDEADALYYVTAKLSVLGDLLKRLGSDFPLLDDDTPLGLNLILGECIDTLKKLGERG